MSGCGSGAPSTRVLHDERWRHDRARRVACEDVRRGRRHPRRRLRRRRLSLRVGHALRRALRHRRSRAHGRRSAGQRAGRCVVEPQDAPPRAVRGAARARTVPRLLPDRRSGAHARPQHRDRPLAELRPGGPLRRVPVGSRVADAAAQRGDRIAQPAEPARGRPRPRGPDRRGRRSQTSRRSASCSTAPRKRPGCSPSSCSTP